MRTRCGHYNAGIRAVLPEVPFAAVKFPKAKNDGLAERTPFRDCIGYSPTRDLNPLVDHVHAVLAFFPLESLSGFNISIAPQ